jgi:hypothetical protein
MRKPKHPNKEVIILRMEKYKEYLRDQLIKSIPSELIITTQAKELIKRLNDKNTEADSTNVTDLLFNHEENCM